MNEYVVAVHNKLTGESLDVHVLDGNAADAQLQAIHTMFYEHGWRSTWAGIAHPVAQEQVA